MFIFNGVFTCEVHLGGGVCVLVYVSTKSANATCIAYIVENLFMDFFVCVFESKKIPACLIGFFLGNFIFMEQKLF